MITHYRWQAPHSIDVVLVRGAIKGMHAWFEIREEAGGTHLRHVEEVEFGWGPIGWIHDLALQRWWQASVAKEVSEIARLMREGERGKGLAAL